MSKVNIKRTVENIRANTTVYSPIVEVVVNALQAIESAGRQDGQITIRIQRLPFVGNYRTFLMTPGMPDFAEFSKLCA